MKNNMLLLVFMVFFLGCETGTRYDKNTTKQTVSKHVPQSGLVNRDDIELLLDDKEEHYYDDSVLVATKPVKEYVNSFSRGRVTEGLDVKQIREGKHKSYIRLVFDVYNGSKPAIKVGSYDAKHNSTKKDIAVVLHGYGQFSAPLPSFPYYSVIEQIHFEQYPLDRGFKFHIKLRENAEVKIFDLSNPARLVFDIKPI